LGFLNAPNYQLSQWGLLLPATVRWLLFRLFFAHISLIGSYAEKVWFEQWRGCGFGSVKNPALEQAMKNHVQLDHVHCQAICSEIGERLQMALPLELLELLPQDLLRQIDRLQRLDEDSPSIVPSMNQNLRS
jgi:hypothetical protein